MIPKVIHQIWLGPKSPPSKCLASWKQMHPGWEYILWREDNLPWEQLPRADFVRQEHTFYGKSDYLRYQLLYLYGGVYIDADSYCLKPIDPLLNVQTFAGMAGTISPYVSNGVIGSTPGSEALTWCVRNMPAPSSNKPVWTWIGPVFFTECTRRFEDSVVVHPSHYFCPVHFKEKPLLDEFIRDPALKHPSAVLARRLKDAYAMQLWGTTWKWYDSLP